MTAPAIHKAEPFGLWAANELGTACRHCGNQIKRVPGGDGPVWVHGDTGAVVGHGAPSDWPTCDRGHAPEPMVNEGPEGAEDDLWRCPVCKQPELRARPRGGS